MTPNDEATGAIEYHKIVILPFNTSPDNPDFSTYSDLNKRMGELIGNVMLGDVLDCLQQLYGDLMKCDSGCENKLYFLHKILFEAEK